MSKDYQKNTARTSAMVELPVPVVPDVVSVAMSEIAADVGEGLLALAVGAGLQVMAAMMAADVDALCGPRGRHDQDRAATRHGSEDGSVALGGRRLAMRRPRVRAADGSGELSIASYQALRGRCAGLRGLIDRARERRSWADLHHELGGPRGQVTPVPTHRPNRPAGRARRANGPRFARGFDVR